MESKLVDLDLDPEIAPVIEELNIAGFSTEKSCIGHPGDFPAIDGYILFSRKYAHGRIRKILRGHGLKGLRVHDVGKPWFTSPKTEVRFNIAGQARSREVTR